MNDNNLVLHQKVEIKVGDKVLPVKEWRMDAEEWPPISPPVSFSAEAIAALLAVDADHQVREVEQGVYGHTFTPRDWMASETESLRDDPWGIPATYHVISQRALRLIFKARAEDRQQERWRKIRRRQKRAAFRRRKRGLA